VDGNTPDCLCKDSKSQTELMTKGSSLRLGSFKTTQGNSPPADAPTIHRESDGTTPGDNSFKPEVL